MTVQANSAGWAGKKALDSGTLDEFDAFPAALKRAFWFAPYNYSTAGVMERMRARGGLRTTLLVAVENMERDVARESLRLYGQAQIGWVA